MSVGVLCIKLHAKTDYCFVHCQVASLGDFEMVQLPMKDIKQ